MRWKTILKPLSSCIFIFVLIGTWVAPAWAARAPINYKDKVEATLTEFKITHESTEFSVGLRIDHPKTPLELSVKTAVISHATGKIIRSPTWKIPLRVQVRNSELNYRLNGKPLVLDKMGRILLPAKEGESELRIEGYAGPDLREVHRVRVFLKTKLREHPDEGNSFFLVGPAVFSRGLFRSGAGTETPGSFSGWATGLRSIYRMRVLKNFTKKYISK